MTKFFKIIFLVLIAALSSNAQEASVDTTVHFIKTQSIDGKLDFKKQLLEEGKANKLLLYDGVAYNIDDYSILLWGKAVKSLGINSIKQAIGLWEEIYSNEMSKPNKKAMKKGFRST